VRSAVRAAVSHVPWRIDAVCGCLGSCRGVREGRLSWCGVVRCRLAATARCLRQAGAWRWPRACGRWRTRQGWGQSRSAGARKEKLRLCGEEEGNGAKNCAALFIVAAEENHVGAREERRLGTWKRMGEQDSCHYFPRVVKMELKLHLKLLIAFKKLLTLVLSLRKS